MVCPVVDPAEQSIASERRVLSAAEVREWGHDELLSAIWHQGTVYEVSAAVVPFLYELLEADGVPDKGLIADLIATVADAHSYLEVHVRTPEETAQWEAILSKEGKTLAAELARERGHVAAVRRGVQKPGTVWKTRDDGAPAALEYCGHPQNDRVDGYFRTQSVFKRTCRCARVRAGGEGRQSGLRGGAGGGGSF
jgi:hypothetical protein